MTLVDDRHAADDMQTARRAMIDSQLRVTGVNSPAILAAFNAVPREDFVPAERRVVAYADRAVPLAGGKVLSPALTYGQMLEAADVTAADTVLVISGNGYLAALAEKLATTVTRHDSLADATGGPYTLILIDGAAEVLPDRLAALLADDGRIVTGLVERGVTRLALARCASGKVAATALGEADFAVLPEFAAPKTWSF
ncbi:protein-L-isoaspartate(D-aspartate) O-methyltransferase [Novosphingobium hassiacum]|uniref:Protein-L-isoaspartate(D-aspartate) O-methyltransferase n=1 Tax=Novosphingobium hassiacum TaxID=173676 RepID=A0A7W5ZTZ9_9SPHN|nr:protein-L-isoaspartate O-methyltransferase [Novosphingobium hassiacum]MBB3859926.1 protein-L-isoaspartate(D-aspartate) O-methyltransferase [Novosphingobium hassiacum]